MQVGSHSGISIATTRVNVILRAAVEPLTTTLAGPHRALQQRLGRGGYRCLALEVVGGLWLRIHPLPLELGQVAEHELRGCA
jgi:hypothetical protein